MLLLKNILGHVISIEVDIVISDHRDNNDDELIFYVLIFEIKLFSKQNNLRSEEVK